jgi:hypothetical protein
MLTRTFLMTVAEVLIFAAGDVMGGSTGFIVFWSGNQNE